MSRKHTHQVPQSHHRSCMAITATFLVLVTVMLSAVAIPPSDSDGSIEAEWQSVGAIADVSVPCMMDGSDGPMQSQPTSSDYAISNPPIPLYAGKTMIDSELRGDQLRLYIDSVSMAILVSAGIDGFATALGALIGGVVVPGVGAVPGAAIGLALGSGLSGIYQFVCEQNDLGNGIWIDITVRGHFTNPITHNMTYYPLPVFMWKLNGYGAQ